MAAFIISPSKPHSFNVKYGFLNFSPFFQLFFDLSLSSICYSSNLFDASEPQKFQAAYSVATCLSHKNTCLGSSKKMVKNLAFSRILSNMPQYNPDFYNWNRVKVRYCDGLSLTGDVQVVNQICTQQITTKCLNGTHCG